MAVTAVPVKQYLTEPRSRGAEGDHVRVLSWLLTQALDRAPAAAGLGSTRGYLLSDLTVVLTGDLAAVGPRLRADGPRVLYQDAGLAIAQLSACAQACGWRVRVGVGDQDQTARLRLDPAREHVTGVVRLEPGPAGASVDQTAGRAVARLLRRPLTYQFSQFGSAVGPARLLARLTAEALAQTGSLWQDGPGAASIGCTVYARAVPDLPPGHYAPAADSRFTPLPELDVQTAAIERYLSDRDLDPPVLVLLTGDLAETLADHGAAGYAALLVKTATAAGLLRPGAARAGLGTGLFARLPAALLQRAGAGRGGGPRVYYGCGIGPPPADPKATARRRVLW